MPKGRLTIATTDLLAHEVNGVGVVTLNRLEAINSLNQPMVSAMHTALTDWATDDDVHTVILTGAGGRGLRAGGDVVAIGIRAQIVDKDRNPKWFPASLAAVTAADVESYFAPADPDLAFGDEEQP